MIGRRFVATARIKYAHCTNRCFATELRYIRMPSIMDAKSGVVDKWLKHVGDDLTPNESLCEISQNDLTIALDCPENGVLADITVTVGETIAVYETIAKYAPSREAYMTYLEEKRIDTTSQEMMAEVSELHEKASKAPDTLALMRKIKDLIKIDAVTDREFISQLQSLARKGDDELMSIFHASFDKDLYDNFDTEFFLDNAQALVKEKIEVIEKKENSY